MNAEVARGYALRMIEFLETNTVPAGLFADDVFCDFTVPTWREQATGLPAVVNLRRAGHPSTGRVPRWRCDPTPTGFVLEVEETWEDKGETWYCREMIRADIEGERIASVSVYCTGDWSPSRIAEHARCVRLLRP